MSRNDSTSRFTLNISRNAPWSNEENTLFLEAVHEFVELVEDRKIRIDRFIDDGMHRASPPPQRQLGPLRQHRPRGFHRRRMPAVHRHQIIPPEEAREVDRLDVVRVLGLLDERNRSDDENEESRYSSTFTRDCGLRLSSIASGWK